MSDSNKRYKPTHYTSKEGGFWKEWPETLPLYEADLDRWAVCGVSRSVKLGNIKIHSISFGNPIGKLRGAFPRWDCINGWTTTLKDIQEMNDGR